MAMSESFQLRLTEPQMRRLSEVQRVTGLGKAEHIRRAVDYYLAGWTSGPKAHSVPQEPAREQPAPLAEPPAPVPVEPQNLGPRQASRTHMQRQQSRTKVARR